MKSKRFFAACIAMVACIAFALSSMHDEPEGRPLVCEQLSPGVKHAKPCSPAQLNRVRDSHIWVIEHAPALSTVSLAGIASFIEDTGRRKRSKFYDLLRKGDVAGACDQMMAYSTRHGEPDPERIVRRGHERALCLTKG